MRSSTPRRDVLRLCGVAFGLGIAGCLGGSPSEPDARETNDSDGTTPKPSATRTRSTTSKRATIAPTDVPNDEAKERALTAEEDYLTERLRSASCLSDWGTYPTTASEQATITERSADGVYVEVVHPYSYSTKPTGVDEGAKERTEADGGSNALYLVTADSIERVRGDSVSPC